MKRFRFSPLAVAVALIGFVSLCSSVARSQSLPLLARSTAIAGLNDSALTLISDSAQRTRAATTHELFKRPAGTAARPSYTFALDSTMGLYRYNTDTLGVALAGVNALRISGGASPRIQSAGNLSLMAGATGATASLTFRIATAASAVNMLTMATTDTSITLASNRLLNSSGTAAKPSYSFSSDQSTGIWLPATASDTLAFSTAGVRSLSLAGSASAKMIGGAGSMTILAGTGNSRTMTLQTTTSAGAAKSTLVLGADSSATVLGRLVVSSTGTTCGSGTPTVQLGAANTGICAISANSGRMGIVNAGALTWYFDESGHLLVNNSDTYDIGTSATRPRAVFGKRIAPVDSILFTGTTNVIAGGAADMTIQSGTGNSRRLALNTTTSAGTSTLAVRFNELQQSLFQTGTTTNPGISWAGDTLTGFNRAGTGTSAIISVVANGQGLINAKRDSIFLLRNVNMGANAATAAGDVNVCIKTTGTVGTVTQGATCGTSTRKVKHGITAINEPVAKLMALRPVTYSYRPQYYGGRTEFGLIAEEAAAVDRRLAFYAAADDRLATGDTIKKGDPLNVNDRAVLALLVATVQRQQRQIDSLLTLTRKKP